jgi:hypothetical protein
MNGARFLLAVVVGSLIGAAIAGCPDIGDIGCQNPDTSHYSCGQQDPCHCYTDTDDPNVGSVTPGACSFPNPCTSPTACGADASVCAAHQICSLGVCQDKPDGGSDASADGPTADAGDASIPSCTGQCLPWLPDPWSSPQLVWIGPQPEAPLCPATASLTAYAGSIDLDAGALPCGQCGCEPPDGGCVLPTTLTANAATCATLGPSTVQTPFDAPPGWDGGCFAGDRIDAGAFGDAGSLTIPPPTVADPPCAAIQPPTPDAGLTMSYAVACIGQVAGACAGGFLCAPSPVTGFQACIAQAGDVACTGSTYTEKHLAFTAPVDMRSCSPCTCGAPAGSTCTVTISAYPDSACATGVTSAVSVDSSGPLCGDVRPGATIGSESASSLTYVPGSCTPAGGVPSGTVTVASPMTFCCIPQS